MKFGRILITGGAGFLGSQLVKRMLPLCEHLYIIDDLSTGKQHSIPNDKKVTFYEGSITDEELLKQVLPNVDYIFHLACKNLVMSVTDVKEDFQTNMLGGFLLLQKAQELCPTLKRFVYASTASVYGNASILPTPETYYNIKLPYPASKFSVEHYCNVYYHMYQMPVTILRFSNVYGPGQLAENPYCGVVAKFFEAIQENGPMLIYGDGSQTRDFTYIDDALDAILLASINKQAIGSVYNVGTEIETSVLELANVIKATVCEADRLFEFHPKRAVDVVERRCVKIEKIFKELGWKAHFSLQEGIKKTYEWLNG